jgi:hypothetical protein
MSKIVKVAGPLPTSTLAAGHAAADALLGSAHPTVSGLRRWMLGDDFTALKVLSDELGICVAVLRSDEGRDDMRAQASDRLRRLARRYRSDVAYGGVETGSIDDTALRMPDAYGRGAQEDQALAA